MRAERPEEETRETMIVLGLDDPKALLSRFELFRCLPDEALAETAEHLEWLSLPGGMDLFQAGEPADAAYLLVSGSLAVVDEDRLPLTRVNAGETVGEMGLMAGRAQAFTVTAVRDCELVRIPRNAFESVLLQHPDAALHLARLAARRLTQAQHDRTPQTVPRTFAVLPAGAGVGLDAFVSDLADALGSYGRVGLVRRERGREHSSQWFHGIEQRHDFVVYAAEQGDMAWSRLCIRQADALLVLANSREAARDIPMLSWREAAGTPRELVLSHPSGFVPGAAAAYRKLLPDVSVHHLRNRRDVGRIARLLTRRAIGLVLSGGGARGFAHIGVVRALRERGIEIDLVGGTSMGAIMAAGVALGWSNEELVERFRRSFVDSNPLSDFTVPLVSLVSGRKVLQLLKREFGDNEIEDLPVPYFCVSANLTTGRLAMHSRGTLWKWLRASIAIPGVLPPLCSDGQVYVDGGAMNNLPVDLMRSLGRGPVIGVDASADVAFTAVEGAAELPSAWQFRRWLRDVRGRPNILQILWRVGMINGAATMATQREQSDLLLRPPMNSLDLLDWQSFDRAIDLGYRHAVETLQGATGFLPA